MLNGEFSSQQIQKREWYILQDVEYNNTKYYYNQICSLLQVVQTYDENKYHGTVTYS